MTRDGLVTRWLRTARPALFALYGGTAAFAAYFAMYAYRKPFTAAAFANVPGWPFAADFKVVLVIAQVAGYALSKLIGIRVVSAMPPARRASGILGLIAAAELSLILFALVPAALAPAALFGNGLALGMIWGLVFAFLEGRRLSEVLGAMLCASFIVSSGVVKTAGTAVLNAQWAGERWMPALTGLMFAPLLVLAVWALAQLPPPDAADLAERAERTPMRAAERAGIWRSYASALVPLVGVYMLLTALRDFRDNFAADIWRELGYGGNAGVFTWSELPVAAAVLVALGLLARVRGNTRAVRWNLALIAAGLALTGASTGLFQLGLLGPAAWMIAVGAGLYLAYTPFNAMLFDRLIAAAGGGGNAGFLIYMADACGYLGSVALLLVRNFGQLALHWTSYLCMAAYATCGVGLLATAAAAHVLVQILPQATPRGMPGRDAVYVS